MTEKQKDIYGGLLKIRPDIAALYKDGLFLRYCELPTRSHAITHYLREIEGGLRDLLDSNKKREESNKTSILRAFDFSEDSELAKKYVTLQMRFPALAHRDSSAITGPRENTEAEKLWDEFEDIIFKLLGSHNALFDRIDTLIKAEEPTKAVLHRIEVIISDPILEHYFFSNLHQIRWLRPLYRETNIFNPENNPQPQKEENGYIIKTWPALNYLKWVSENIHELPTDRQQGKMWELVSLIVDNIATFRKDGVRNRNGFTDSVLHDLIYTMPIQCLALKHFNYIREFASTGMGGWLEYNFQVLFLNKLLSIGSCKQMLYYLNVLFAYNFRESKRSLFGEPETSYVEKEDISLFKNVYMNIENCIEKIVDVCSISGLKVLLRIFMNRLKDIRYAEILYIGESNPSRTYEESGISSIAFTIRDYLLYLPMNKHYLKIIKCFLDNDNSILKRIGYYIVSQKYDDLKDVFWSLTNNPFNNTNSNYELYQILKKNPARINHLEIQQLLSWLDSIELNFKGTPSHKAFIKKQYLAAFNKIENSDIDAFLIECNKDYPDAVSDNDLIPHHGLYGTAAKTDHPNFEGNSLAEISFYYIEAKKVEDKVHHFRYYNNLFYSLQNDIYKNPDKYFHHISAMTTADRDFQKDWLMLLEKFIREDSSYKIPETLFDTIKVIINEKFWNSYKIDSEEKDIYSNIIEKVLSFIKLLLEKNLIPCSKMEVVKDILLTISECKDNDETMIFNFDIYNYYHSNEYLLFSDFILFSYNQYKYDPNKVVIPDIIKSTIERKFDDKTVSPFFYFALASHFNYLQYLQPDWSESLISKIFNITIEENYKAALTGWLLTPSIDKNLFFYLKKNKVFEYIFFNKDIFKRDLVRQAVNRICSAYVNDLINVDDSLIELIIEADDSELMSDVTICMGTEEKQIISFDKIEVLWKKIIDRYEDKGISDAYSSFADNSYCLIKKYPLTETLLDIIETLVHVPGKHRFYSYIHFLLPRLAENPPHIARIIVVLIKNEQEYVTHGDMKKNVTWLYENGYGESANEICDAYASKGNQGLRDVYKRYKDL